MNFVRVPIILTTASLATVAGAGLFPSPTSMGGSDSGRLYSSDARLQTIDIASTPRTTTIDLSGVAVWDLQGDPDNIFLMLDLGAGSTITGIGYDLVITTEDPSWLSEVNIDFANTSGMGSVNFIPGPGDEFSGEGIYSYGGIVDLIALGFDFVLDDDGLLKIEFYDSIANFPDAPDAFFKDNSLLTIQYKPVPNPGSMALLGLAGLVAIRRRRV